MIIYYIINNKYLLLLFWGTMSTKLRVAVLMGGKSIEREVSFNSGRTICDHLDTSRYDIIPLFQRANGKLYILPWRFLHRGKISDFEHRLDTEAQNVSWDDLKNLVDFVYIATHGRFAEDGTLQGTLEVLQIPYLGSKVMASALGMDKAFQKKVLKANNINVPNGIDLKPNEIEFYKNNPQELFNTLRKENINLPCIIKPSKEGSSLGMSVVKKEEDLIPAIIAASKADNNRVQDIIIEQYLTGLEFSCIIITDYKTGKYLPLPPTEIVREENSDFYDYEQKYMPGRAQKFTPARTNESTIKNIQDACIEVMKILGIENLSRTDGFVTHDNKIYIIDPNTLSGMGPASFFFRQAAEINMSHTNIINHLIESELTNYNMLDAIIKKEKDSENQMNNLKKLRVAVLLGGRSNEKEISLESGRNIYYKLSPQKYEAIAIFVDANMELYKIDQHLLVRNSTKEITLGLKPEMKIQWSNLPEIADFVFIGLHGGEGENGCVQGTLEMLGMPYNGSSVLTSAMCMDKYKTNEFLKSQGFDVPNNYLASKEDWQNQKENLIKIIENKLGNYPYIIKPHDDGCSVFVSKANNQKDLQESLDTIFANNKNFALIEEFVTGMELTVGVIGNENPASLPPSQTVANKGILSIEEKFLPGAGENQTPAPLPTQTLEFVKKVIANTYKALNCKGYSRIDCFYQSPEASSTKSERVVIIEVNTLPGMTPATCIFHQAAEIGIKPMDFIDIIIQLGMQEHKKEVLSFDIEKITKVNEEIAN